VKVLAKRGAKSAIGWLEPDATHLVLAVSSVPSKGSRYLLWSEKQQSVALFPAYDFEIVDPNMSPVWVASVDLNGYLELSPQEWLTDGFWERFHEGDPKAVTILRKGIEAIKKQDSGAP